MFLNILFALSTTLLFEGLIYFFVSKYNFKLSLIMGLSNIILNVTMNLLLNVVNTNQYLITLISFEIFTFLVEAFIFYLFSKEKLYLCFLYSLTANILSLTIGYLFNLSDIVKEKGLLIILSLIFLNLYLGLLFAAFFLNGKNDKNSNTTDKAKNE